MLSFVAKRLVGVRNFRLLARTYATEYGEAEEINQVEKNGESEESEEPRRSFEKCVNQVNLLGRVGRDAEIRGTEERPVVLLSLATNQSYKTADGTRTSRVSWHRVGVFRMGLRDSVSKIKKGDRVFVTGSMQYNEYTREDSVTIRTATVVANDIINLTKKYVDDIQSESS